MCGLAVGAEILGARWARDHANDKKPALAAALETAFDPEKSSACIGLDQASRDSAAAWLPPGMAYADPEPARAEDSEPAGDAAIEPDPSQGDTDGIDAASDELPVFLTEEGLAALNGASAP